MLGFELGELGSRVQDLNHSATPPLRLGQRDLRARLEWPKDNIQASGTMGEKSVVPLGMTKGGNGSKGRQVSAHWMEELPNEQSCLAVDGLPRVVPSSLP